MTATATKEERLVVVHTQVGQHLHRGDVVPRERVLAEVGDPAGVERLLALGAVRPAAGIEQHLDHVHLDEGSRPVVFEQMIGEKDREMERLRLALAVAETTIAELKTKPPAVAEVTGVEPAERVAFRTTVDDLQQRLAAANARLAEMEKPTADGQSARRK